MTALGAMLAVLHRPLRAGVASALHLPSLAASPCVPRCRCTADASCDCDGGGVTPLGVACVCRCHEVQS